VMLNAIVTVSEAIDSCSLRDCVLCDDHPLTPMLHLSGQFSCLLLFSVYLLMDLADKVARSPM
jgi:hypothetical protein